MKINFTKSALTSIKGALGLVIIIDEESNPNDKSLVTEGMKYLLKKLVRLEP